MKVLLGVLLLISGCSFKKNNQTLKGHEELYSEPSESKLTELSENEVRVVIASTNDIHGNYSPTKFTIKDNHNPETQSILIGGEATIGAYFSILRETYKNVVLVDSGDIFSTADEVKKVEQFYESNQYDAVTIGLRDFNLKVPSRIGNTSDLFQSFARSSKTPLLLSNLYELKTARVVEWEGTKSHILKDVNGIKVGIIGLIPDDIVAQTPVNNRVGLFVDSMLQSTLRQSRLLRSLGADMIVVMTHQGFTCGKEQADKLKLPLAKVNFEPEKSNVCKLNNNLGEYLNRLPPGLVDVVVGGRTHEKIANFVNGILVMAGYPDGRSFNFAEFVVDKKAKRIVPEKTVPHQPVYFCNEFFKETNDCYPDDASVDHKKRIPAKFLGQDITPDVTASVREHSPSSKIDITKKLATFSADLSYFPETTGDTQLFIMKLSGRELVKILEEEFNKNATTPWQPSPYLLKKKELHIQIGGQGIDLNKEYRVLTDLESLQNHSTLVKRITTYDSESLVNHSWNSMDEDLVNTRMASQAR